MTRVTPNPSEISNIYIDETSQNKHDYLVLGGVIIHSQSINRFNEIIEIARKPELPFGEMKWEKVSRSKLGAYKRVVDAFFDEDIDCKPMEFHSVIVYTPNHVYPDERQTKNTLEELRQILNFGMRKKGDQRDWPFRRIHFQNSKKVYALQLVDILIGGLAYRLNRHHAKEGASPAKTELSQYILERAGIQNLYQDTRVSGKFTIWHRQLR